MTDPVDAHLLIVDDDDNIRGLLQKYLARNGFWVTAARSAEHARRIMLGLEFDLIVLDAGMPTEDGFSLAAELQDPGTAPVLMMTARDADREPAIAAGARDALAKPFEPKALLARINAILQRDPRATEPALPRLMRLGPVRYDLDRGELWHGEERVRLTATESQLMRIFSASPGTAMSRAKLVEELGRDKGQAQERAVDVQITRLRRKLEPDPKAPRYLQTVRGEGYLLAPD